MTFHPKGLRAGSKRATELIAIPKEVLDSPAFAARLAARQISIEEFIETRGSGTLRKNKAIGMNVTSHALHERIAYEFGYFFEACPERFVTWGEPRSEGDCKPLTEAGWHTQRYAEMCLFPGDEMSCKYIQVEIDGEKREGVGIVIRQTSAPWVPKGHMVFCIIAEYNVKKGHFKNAINPC